MTGFYYGGVVKYNVRYLLVLCLLLPIQAFASSWLVYNLDADSMVTGNDQDVQRPIASITKMFTAITVLASGVNLFERVSVKSPHKGRLPNNAQITRIDLLRLMLVASDNRAADSLANAHPGGYQTFIEDANELVKKSGLEKTVIVDASGILSGNISTAIDLAKFANNLRYYPLLLDIASVPKDSFKLPTKKSAITISYNNTNPDISKYSGLLFSKTGFTSAAGRCLFLLFIQGNELIGIVVLGEKNVVNRSKTISKLVASM